MVSNTEKEKVYLAGPMRGIPYFNFPLFNKVAQELRDLNYEVFNPAQHDEEQYGTDISAGNHTGSNDMAVQEHGFSLREALAADTSWICLHADAICMLPGWEVSKGAVAEHALAKALDLKVIYYTGEFEYAVA